MGIILTQGEIDKISQNISNIESIANNLSIVKNSASEIIGSDSLVGLSYERLRNYCKQNFNPIVAGFENGLIEKYKEITESMKNDFTAVLSGYSKLDTSQLPELKKRLKSLENALNTMYRRRHEWEAREENRYYQLRSSFITVNRLCIPRVLFE